MTDKLTERLRTALTKAGYTDPRNGNPSIRALAVAVDLNNSRVARYFYHGSSMRLEAREAIAEALDMDVAELDSEVAQNRVDTYSPPEAANSLTPRERRLVNELIHVLAERHETRKAGEGNAKRAPSNTMAGEDVPAHDDTDDEPPSPEDYNLAAFRGIPGEKPGDR